MMQISDVTGRRYEAEDCVFFRNYIQSAFYIAHGCELVDIFTDSKMKLVFVFWKKEHNNMIELWMNNKIVKEMERERKKEQE